MNNQPYRAPDRHWPPKMTPWWFRATDLLRRSALRERMFVSIKLTGVERLQAARKEGCGILLTPNHSFHWDSYCLLESAQQMSCPFYFMTAWQVFAQSSWFDRMSMQRCGCFSVDREGNDMQAMKTAVDILQNRHHPLVIFPEGDVYHTNDRITAFRDGAAALALMAARKATRKIVVIPVAIKQWYLADPSPSIRMTLADLEKRLYWRVQDDRSDLDRILQIADGVLSLKELERFQTTRPGPLAERIRFLTNHVLTQVETRYGIVDPQVMIPERIKEVRRRIIDQQQKVLADGTTSEQQSQWSRDMEDMFFVTQLYSYPGDYLIENPTVERMAETVDKLEEDLLGAVYPTVREKKHVQVSFGEPIELPQGKDKKLAPSELTIQIESAVQSMLDTMNREYRFQMPRSQSLTPS
jgi:hypothetical protein